MKTFKRFIRRILAFLVFRSYARPDRIVFLGRGPVYFDPEDHRSQWLRRSAGLTQAGITALWRAAEQALRPELVIDVGANYGEVSLSHKYATADLILLFEPSPRLAPYLRKSISEHVNAKKIRFHNHALSDVNGIVDFSLDKRNSGSSSIRRIVSPDVETIAVETKTLESCLPKTDDFIDSSILFKIDVEGYEGSVLKGMRSCLHKARSYIGIIEFDKAFLDNSGFTAQETLDTIKELGAVYQLDRENRLVPVQTLKDIAEHTDLVMFSDDALRGRVRISRMVRTR